jgi:hypothetical protein
MEDFVASRRSRYALAAKQRSGHHRYPRNGRQQGIPTPSSLGMGDLVRQIWARLLDVNGTVISCGQHPPKVIVDRRAHRMFCVIVVGLGSMLDGAIRNDDKIGREIVGRFRAIAIAPTMVRSNKDVDFSALSRNV